LLASVSALYHPYLGYSTEDMTTLQSQLESLKNDLHNKNNEIRKVAELNFNLQNTHRDDQIQRVQRYLQRKDNKKLSMSNSNCYV